MNKGGAHRLALAIVAQAASDATDLRPWRADVKAEAIAWLQDEGPAWIFLATGLHVDPDMVLEYIQVCEWRKRNPRRKAGG